MRLAEAFDLATARLSAAGVEQPRREARLLAAHLLGEPPGRLLDPDRQIEAGAFSALVARRAAREPMAYITGRQGFWSLDLTVSPDTLVPRADSETLIEAALAAFPDRPSVRRILDLGTGTGCLLLAALSEFGGAFGIGVDLSPGAAALAAGNARACGLADRCAFAAGDWAASLAGQFDLVLANPPYVASAELAGLMPEVGRHEPHRALNGGESGLEAYRVLMPALPGLLAPGGVAILELGLGQAGPVAALANEAGLALVSIRQDLGGIARAAILRCAGRS
jgi:release factor glutamine methyltransferase